MRTHLIAIAALVGGSLTVTAQTPETQKPQPQQQRPTETRPTGDTTQRTGQNAQNTQKVTVTGCLKPASEAAGRQTAAGTGSTTSATGSTTSPTGSTTSATGSTTSGTGTQAGNRSNTNRGSTGGNFVLTNVKMAQGSATSGMGLASSYQLSGIADAELQKHVNHQVEITGTLSRGDAQGNRGASAAPGSAAEAHADLPNLMGTSLKMVSASCPAAQ